MKTTILICTPDATGERYARCADSVRKTTRGMDVEIITFDNRNSDTFRHAHEINRALAIADNHLVTLDDDVIVEGAWLESMLDYGEDYQAGVVACTVRRPQNQTLWSAGLQFDADGHVINHREQHATAIQVPAACSCCWLMRTRRKVDETHYRKYYFDPAYCLALWANGLPTIVVPEWIYHEGAGTARKDKHHAATVEIDRQTFKQAWLDSALLADMREQYKFVWQFDAIRGTECPV